LSAVARPLTLLSPVSNLSKKKRYIRVNIYIMLLVLHVLFTYILDADGMAKSFSIILAMTAAD